MPIYIHHLDSEVNIYVFFIACLSVCLFSYLPIFLSIHQSNVRFYVLQGKWEQYSLTCTIMLHWFIFY